MHGRASGFAPKHKMIAEVVRRIGGNWSLDRKQNGSSTGAQATDDSIKLHGLCMPCLAIINSQVVSTWLSQALINK